MIPKVIHYCWFGGGEKDELTTKCIETWKRVCPDYIIKEWNENNYDVTKNRYMYEAYQEKRWGFVSDYARLDIVYENGGIYLDTDVEVIKPFDDLLDVRAFFGFESSASRYAVNTGGGFGAAKGEPFLKGLLHTYDTLRFKNENGTLNLTPCPTLNSEYFVDNGFLMNNQFQIINGVALYPCEYFSPFSLENNKGKQTRNTYSIHHYNASWLSPEEKKRLRAERRLDYIKHLPNMALRKVLGNQKYEKVKRKLKES